MSPVWSAPSSCEGSIRWVWWSDGLKHNVVLYCVFSLQQMAEMAGEWMAEHKVKFQRKCVPTKVSRASVLGLMG